VERISQAVRLFLVFWEPWLVVQQYVSIFVMPAVMIVLTFMPRTVNIGLDI
jgi:hypothetical protein